MVRHMMPYVPIFRMSHPQTVIVDTVDIKSCVQWETTARTISSLGIYSSQRTSRRNKGKNKLDNFSKPWGYGGGNVRLIGEGCFFLKCWMLLKPNIQNKSYNLARTSERIDNWSENRNQCMPTRCRIMLF